MFKCFFFWFIVFFSTCGRVCVCGGVMHVCAWVLNTTKNNNNQGALQLTRLCECKTKLISQTATATKYKVHKRSSFNSFHVCVSVPVCVHMCVCVCMLICSPQAALLIIIFIILSLCWWRCHFTRTHTQSLPSQDAAYSALLRNQSLLTHTHTHMSTHMHAHSCRPHPTVIRGEAKVNVMREHAKGHKYKHRDDCVCVCAINHFIVYKSFN